MGERKLKLCVDAAAVGPLELHVQRKQLELQTV